MCRYFLSAELIYIRRIITLFSLSACDTDFYVIVLSEIIYLSLVRLKGNLYQKKNLEK